MTTQERKITITYLLSEEGRRADLLAGGDGKREQRFITEATPELIKLATISTEGVDYSYLKCYDSY